MSLTAREMANHLRYIFYHVDYLPEVTTLALNTSMYLWMAAQCKGRLEGEYQFKTILLAATKLLRSIVLMPDQLRNRGFNCEMKVSREPMKQASDLSDNLKYSKELFEVNLVE